jgi:hypothetical protein
MNSQQLKGHAEGGTADTILPTVRGRLQGGCGTEEHSMLKPRDEGTWNGAGFCWYVSPSISVIF